MSRLIQDVAFWWYGLTPSGRREAIWYAVRRLFIKPVSEDRCCMGAPVHPMVWCPRPITTGWLWCDAHQRELEREHVINSGSRRSG